MPPNERLGPLEGMTPEQMEQFKQQYPGGVPGGTPETQFGPPPEFNPENGSGPAGFEDQFRQEFNEQYQQQYQEQYQQYQNQLPPQGSYPEGQFSPPPEGGYLPPEGSSGSPPPPPPQSLKSLNPPTLLGFFAKILLGVDL